MAGAVSAGSSGGVDNEIELEVYDGRFVHGIRMRGNQQVSTLKKKLRAEMGFRNGFCFCKRSQLGESRRELTTLEDLRISDYQQVKTLVQRVEKALKTKHWTIVKIQDEHAGATAEVCMYAYV